MKTLTANDICRGDFYIGGKCCLLGHLIKVETGLYDIMSQELHHVICYELKLEDRGISGFNDNPKYPLDLIARVWNRAMFRCATSLWEYGYSCDTENQPLEPFKENTDV